MKRTYFGTDGVRGRVGDALINPQFLRRLAYAAGTVLKPADALRPTAVIGRDTRASGAMLAPAVSDALIAAGWNVIWLGVAPTPAVSLATREREASLGVVLTASHNPASDNGIKFFSATGEKLSDAVELQIEAALPRPDWTPGTIADGEVTPAEGGEEYVRLMTTLLPADSLAGWKIAFDGANGATCGTTPGVLRALGAEVVAIGCEPDGSNINSGVGSEHPERLAGLVKSSGARIGIAHDGDGDRVVLCDETGSALDGDEVMTLLACDALERGSLVPRKVVMTVQSNMGVDAAVRAAGGELVRCDVGDRYVAAAMKREGAVIGGESSGHFIFSKAGPTGDGLVAALEVLRVMIATGKPLSELRGRLVRFPQATAAIRVRDKKPLENCPAIGAAIASAEAALGAEGRVLVRYSGTEPKIRLLVESRSESDVSFWMVKLRAAVDSDLEPVRD